MLKKENKLKSLLTKWTWKKFIITVLLTLVVSLAVIFFIFANRANSTLNNITGENNSIFETARTFLPGKKVMLNNENGRTNILILGMRGENDPHGGTLTDSIIILSIDQNTNKAAMISIPRDLRVTIPGYKGFVKLNAAHALGQDNDGKGLEYTKSTLAEATGMQIHYGATIDFTAFKGIIDALDGITVDAAEDFYDPNYEGGIRVKKGLNEMDSDRALKYVWARLSTSDFDRSRRQREVINAIKNKAEAKGIFTNPIFLLETLESLGNHVKTDMSVDEMKKALDLVGKLDLSSIIEKGYDTSADGPFTSKTDKSLGYIIIPRAGNFTVFQKDIQGIFGVSSEPQEVNEITGDETKTLEESEETVEEEQPNQKTL